VLRTDRRELPKRAYNASLLLRSRVLRGPRRVVVQAFQGPRCLAERAKSGSMTICSSATPAADVGAASRIGNSRIRFPGSSIRRIRIIRDCIYPGFPLAARSCRRDSFESEIIDRYSTNRIGTICEQCFTYRAFSTSESKIDATDRRRHRGGHRGLGARQLAIFRGAGRTRQIRRIEKRPLRLGNDAIDGTGAYLAAGLQRGRYLL
jgi:hypothetical protein